ncbi:FUN14 domain-containing protein 1 [Gracilariopsis chorda]|uniref:FUN14 domain-containing protein 1 n=1 Tax=Gracilariopsis chorda TaxID=448386 RepID=A0A2V3IN71_9FLOR|nr:FUN14 domain-containing protein 1 [Gracilariopsis chorda]|eukprot:PXF43522.1 FUN14 domain-containing protein 1 [Gracilariopsis chorda]
MAERSSIIIRASSAFSGFLNRSTLAYGAHPAVLVTLAAVASSTAAAEESNPADTDHAQDRERTEPKSLEDTVEKKPIVQSIGEQVSFGAVLGFATGYSIRKIGKLILLVVGTEVVVLQYMAYRQWLVMDWRRIGRDLSPKFNRSMWDGLLNVLLYKMPFSAAFSGGLAAGLRLSYQK